MRRRIGMVVALGAVALGIGAGGAAALNLAGTKSANLLAGSKGPDRLIGRAGNDLLKGRAGNDLLRGGAGRDLLVGGSGADRIGGGTIDPNQLEVTTAQGLTCLPLGLGCLFTITGNGADALVGNVTAGGGVSSVTNLAVNGLVTGTWLATGTYTCAGSGPGYLVVHIGTKSSPQIPVTCA